jgi:hypothetical protein
MPGQQSPTGPEAEVAASWPALTPTPKQSVLDPAPKQAPPCLCPAPFLQAQPAAMLWQSSAIITVPALHILQADDLEEGILEDLSQGLIPCYVCATIGTTSSCAVDPADKIGQVTQRHGVW